jgi:Protein of unknown function (DUF4127)
MNVTTRPSHYPEVILLPLDDRPVNYDYPRMLAAVAGIQVKLPPREWLGNPWRDSQHENMIEWLRDTPPNSNAVIIAIDTLTYGGLIPSRIKSDSFETVIQYLGILSELKAANPNRPIYASSVIQRVSRANSSEEEKPYWAEYGSRMFRLSYLEHKMALKETSVDEIAEKDSLLQDIPPEIYSDYLGIRARNHKVNEYMLDFVKNGVVDYLLLPQDDTADYGWNIAEAHHLQMLIRRGGLTERAITYPGADEIGCLLLARHICARSGFTPKVFPRFSSSSSATLITEYEDRPMLELLKAHLAPLGGVVADDQTEADFLLFINAPAIKQGVGELQWAAHFSKDELLQKIPEALKQYAEDLYSDEHFQMTRYEMQTPRRSTEEFCRAVVNAVRLGEQVAVADVAFVNGSDLILGNQLVHHPEIARLAGYGGWNTAGNTLGTVIAQAVIYIVALKDNMQSEQRKAHLEFLFLRFLDDYCYQALERSLCMFEDLPVYGLSPTEARLPNEEIARSIEKRVAGRLEKQAKMLEKLFQDAGLLKAVRLSDIYLPWQRLFEIGCTVSADLQVEGGA